jgi:hypothetical protein
MFWARLVLADAPVRKDLVIATAGGAAALAGLILVFLGVVIVSYQAYPGGTPSRLLKPYRLAMGAILAAFALSLLCAGLGVAWLATGGGAGPLYELALWTFFLDLVAILAVAIGTTYRVVLA